MDQFDIEIPSNPQAPVAESAPAAPAAPVNHAVELPDVQVGVSQSAPSYVVTPDAKSVAIKFGIIGAGQGGSRLADTFYQTGYRRVCAVNTTAQDFLGLTLPEKHQRVFEESEGGAGKDPQKGTLAVKKSQEEVLNLMRHSFGEDIDHILVCAGMGGGCFSGDTKVFTKEFGIVPMSDLVDIAHAESTPENHETGAQYAKFASDLHVLSMVQGRCEYVKASHGWKVPEKESVMVDYGNGFASGNLHVSEDHPVFVYLPTEDKLVEVKAGNLQQGDLVVRGEIPQGCGNTIEEDYAWFLGYFAGDGNFKFTGPSMRCLRLFDGDKQSLEKAAVIATKYGATSVKISKDDRQNSYECYIYGKEFCQRIHAEYLYVQPKTGNLRLPLGIATAEKSTLVAYLSGLVDSDGYVKKGRQAVDICMVDITFLEDLAYVLNLHGIKSTVGVRKSRRENERDMARLYIADIKEIGLNLLVRKTNNIEVEKAHPNLCGANHMVPFSWNQISHLVTSSQDIGPIKDYIDDKYRIVKMRFVQHIVPNLKPTSLFSTIWDKLTPINSVRRMPAIHMYDLTVENGARFYAGNHTPILVHNTGTGSVVPLIKLAKAYMRSIQKAEKVGVVVSLPKYNEGGKVQENAYQQMKELVAMEKGKEISPMVVTDNQMIHQMFPNVSAKSFWATANKNTVGLFDIFNVLACQRSAYVTFDRADYKSILESGVLALGALALDKFEKDTDIADGLRNNLKRTLLVDVDLQKATHVAAILAAPDRILSILPQSYIDLAFTTMERIMDGENRGLVMHQGVYESTRNGLFAYTMVGGLSIPESRLEAMRVRAGIDS